MFFFNQGSQSKLFVKLVYLHMYVLEIHRKTQNGKKKVFIVGYVHV